MILSTAFAAALNRRIRPSFRAGWIIFAVVTCIVSAQLYGQTVRLTTSQVQAGFLINLVKFVEWPDAAFPSVHEPLTFGIIGSDSLANVLSRAAYGQSIKGRTVVVRKYDYGDDLSRCQVLFVSASEQARVHQILASVLGASVLTVSDAQRFAEAGGVVQITVEEDRVRFSVNREAAARAGLQISAKLLTLSHVISTAGGPGTK
jgi:YfiR/HmsC-like